MIHCSAGVGRTGVVILTQVMKWCLEHNQVGKSLVQGITCDLILLQTVNLFCGYMQAVQTHFRCCVLHCFLTGNLMQNARNVQMLHSTLFSCRNFYAKYKKSGNINQKSLKPGPSCSNHLKLNKLVKRSIC